MSDCPRLTRQIAAWRAMYRHLTERDETQLRHYHTCGDCAPQPARHLPRDPETK